MAVLNSGRFKVNINKEQIEKTKGRCKSLAQGEIPDRVPFIFTPYGFKWANPAKRHIAENCEDWLEFQVARINFQVKEFPEGDYVPFLWDGLGTMFMASLYGLDVFTDEKQGFLVKDRLIHRLEKDIERVPEHVDPENIGLGPELKRRVKLFLEATEGEIMIFLPNIQCPYDVAVQLMGNDNFIIAAYDTPDLIHELLKRVTNATRDVIYAMQKWVGNTDLLMLDNTLPFHGHGLKLHDDYVSVLSPDFHKEFCYPYNMQLYQEFGFGSFHTCGPYLPHYCNAIFRHKGITAIEAHGCIRTCQQRSRNDLLELKTLCMENNVAISACLDTMGENVIPPDRKLLQKMAENGGLRWYAAGTRQTGLEYLKWAEEAYR